MNLPAIVTAGSPAPQNPFFAFIPFLLIIAVFYLLIIRPQQKRSKETRKMLDALKSGDKVVTIGGIHGTIISIDDKSVVLRIADNVKVTFSKSAIAYTLNE